MEDAVDQKTLSVVHLQKLLIKNNVPVPPEDRMILEGADNTNAENAPMLLGPMSESPDGTETFGLSGLREENSELKRILDAKAKSEETLQGKVAQLQFEKSLRDKLEVMVQKELQAAKLWKKKTVEEVDQTVKVKTEEVQKK